MREEIDREHRFIVYPGEVRSTSDYEIRFISFGELCRFYGLPEAQCLEHSPGIKFDHTLPPLHPRGDGQYEEALKRMKINHFRDYEKQCKLYHHNNDNRDRTRKLFAEQNLWRARAHERTWPDFEPALTRIYGDKYQLNRSR